MIFESLAVRSKVLVSLRVPTECDTERVGTFDAVAELLSVVLRVVDGVAYVALLETVLPDLVFETVFPEADVERVAPLSDGVTADFVAEYDKVLPDSV